MKTHVVIAVAVAIMALIATGLYVTTRGVHDAPASEQALLRDRLRLLEEKVEADAGRGADAIGELKTALDELRAEVVKVSETLSLQAATASELEARLAALEATEPATGAERVGETESGKPLVDGYTSPISLADDLRAHADRISPRILEQSDLDGLIRFALESGLVPFPNRESIPPPAMAALERLFARYQESMALVTQREHVRVEELMREADEDGDYVEIPRDAPDVPKRLEDAGFNDRGTGISQMITLRPLNVRRFYSFPYEEHPELVQLSQMRDNARDHLIRDLSRVR